jgi:hypothetical protein
LNAGKTLKSVQQPCFDVARELRVLLLVRRHKHERRYALRIESKRYVFE